MAGQREILSGLGRVFHLVIYSPTRRRYWPKTMMTRLVLQGLPGSSWKMFGGSELPFLPSEVTTFSSIWSDDWLEDSWSWVTIKTRKPNVLDVVRGQLHVRLIDADLREQTPLLPLHNGLPAGPWLHDSPLPQQVNGNVYAAVHEDEAYDFTQGLPRGVGGSTGDVERPEGGEVQHGRRLQQPKHCRGDKSILSFQMTFATKKFQQECFRARCLHASSVLTVTSVPNSPSVPFTSFWSNPPAWVQHYFGNARILKDLLFKSCSFLSKTCTVLFCSANPSCP